MDNAALLVRDWTEKSSGQPLPPYPIAMKHDEVGLVAKFVVEEVLELLGTVYEPDDAKMMLENIACEMPAREDIHPAVDHTERIADQADAMIDIIYYILNACAKKCINLGPVFMAVHKANVNKQDKDGKYIRNETGKVLKPEGWKAPDIKAVIKNQIENGSWTYDEDSSDCNCDSHCDFHASHNNDEAIEED
jgi:predicted HAD superfamily Cof-like phosphohydrolase